MGDWHDGWDEFAEVLLLKVVVVAAVELLLDVFVAWADPVLFDGFAEVAVVLCICKGLLLLLLAELVATLIK